MKEFMMIIGSKILDNDWMELILVPLTLAKKKKVNLMDLASGNMDTLLQEVTGSKVHESRLYMKLETWGDMKLKLGSHITVELNVEEI
jgi:hypothetical protein